MTSRDQSNAQQNNEHLPVSVLDEASAAVEPLDDGRRIGLDHAVDGGTGAGHRVLFPGGVHPPDAHWNSTQTRH